MATIPFIFRKRKGNVKVLITEIGSSSSGDEAICVAAASRLIAMGAEVTFCFRVSLEDALRKAKLKASQVFIPIEEEFEGISTIDELINVFAESMPETYIRLKRLLLNHDAVAIAPGGKFTEGFKNARALLTSAVALSLDIPVMLLHQSVGPIDNPNHRKLLTEVFSRCSLLLIRDDLSLKFLRDLGIPDDNLVRCRDVALAENYPMTAKPDYDLGINIRCGFTGHVKKEALSRFLIGYKALRPDSRTLVYSTTWNLPADIVDYLSSLPCDIRAKMPSYPNYVNDIGRCAVNVSDSWHGVIFSMLADRPTICCQTDLRTWKLEGAHAPGQVPLTVLPGLISEQDAETVLRSVIDVQENPAPVLGHQRCLVEYGKKLCEEGWAAVERTLASIITRRNIFNSFLRRVRIWR
jgi:hypothetical protein